jgi:ankyrin repeat protein
LHGRTALLTAAFEGNLKNVKNLIEKGADVNVKKKDGKTALLLASGNSNGLQIIQYLIQNGAKINAQTKDGYSPLMWAAYNGNIKIVKELIQVLNLRGECSLWCDPQRICKTAILNFSK